MSKEEIKNLLIEFVCEYDFTNWSNDKVYEKFSDLIYKNFTDLETKLAEKDEQLEYFSKRDEEKEKQLEKQAEFHRKSVLELKQQLAESEETIKYLKGIKRYDIGEMLTENIQLKQQLAEKDAEIEQWKSMAERSSSMLDRFNYCGESTIYSTTREQDKILFCIERLEKLKDDFFDIGNGWWLCFRDGTQYMTHDELEGCVKDVIDNQIKQLKEK